jgi:parvulin-like peptidyl-prolyl isomerase
VFGVTILVNGEAIEEAEVVSVEAELSAQDPSMAVLESAQRRERAESAVIERTLVRQEAQSNGPEIRAVDVKRELKVAMKNAGTEEAFNEYLASQGVTLAEIESDIELRLKIDAMLDQVCAGLPRASDEECRSYYDDNAKLFETEEHVHAAHIVRHCAGNALEEHAAHAELTGVHERIQAGEPFESFTQSNNDCPDEGGDLGFFGRGQMVPDFEEVVFSLKPGEVSGVFKTEFGLHIAKVIDYVPAAPRAFEDVVEEVRDHLFTEAENGCIDAFTASLKDKADIKRT